MAQYLWFVYALTAAILWGAGYVLAEKLMKEDGITPAFLMAASVCITMPLYFLLSISLGHLKPGIETLTANKDLIILVVMVATMTVAGNFFILMSVSEKNATLAALVEITYPLFTFLFAYLILKDVQLTWATAGGAVLILTGVGIIVAKG